ncbi:hypothetical protein BY458DRAFT_545049 [Sporodiniella umbellata]|nr:hypothetical protein BY458DRAFT_545049 [Sporodiniella umbellata]
MLSLTITTAIQATVNEDNEVDWDMFLIAEKETIINSYYGTYLNVFKRTWKHPFKEVASRLNFRIKNDSGDTNNWQTLIYDELKAKRKTSFISASTTTSTKSTKSVHNNSISADDKKSAITYLEKLPVEEKWRLKSGRFIEDVVMQAINDSTFEHPCLSYIVDLADPIWPNYFSPEETDEVRTYNSVELPKFTRRDTKLSADYYEFASDQKLKFSDSFEKRWIKEYIMNSAGLFEEGELLNTNDFSEGDLLHTLWTFVYGAFKKKLVGCAEVGKHDVLVIDDKYLDDGMVKLPKTIRDMLCGLVEANPHRINQLYTIGFLMMGLNLELLIMNVPAGKTVTKITRTKKLPFPARPIKRVVTQEIYVNLYQVKFESSDIANVANAMDVDEELCKELKLPNSSDDEESESESKNETLKEKQERLKAFVEENLGKLKVPEKAKRSNRKVTDKQIEDSILLIDDGVAIKNAAATTGIKLSSAYHYQKLHVGP